MLFRSKHGKCLLFSGRRGFTLPEIMVSSVIVVLVFSGLIGTYIFIQSSWQNGIVLAKLQRDASIALQQMARGTRGNDGIREAVSVTTPADGTSSNTITYTAIDGTVKSYYFSADDNEILYDPDTSVSGAVVLLENVSSLSFTRDNRLITIDISLSDTVMNETLTVSFESVVCTRN